MRTNAQLVPFEAALTGAGIPFTVRGVRFFARRRARRRRAQARRHRAPLAYRRDPVARRARFRRGRPRRPGRRGAGPARGAGHAAGDRPFARGRSARRHGRRLPCRARTARRRRGRCRRRGRHAPTLHRAKGLEWDAVFLPMLEEGRCRSAVGLRSGRARRGAAPPLRRDHRAAGTSSCPGRQVGSAPRGPRLARGRRDPSPSFGRTRWRVRSSRGRDAHRDHGADRGGRATPRTPDRLAWRARGAEAFRRRGRQQDAGRHRRPAARRRGAAARVPGIGQREMAM